MLTKGIFIIPFTIFLFSCSDLSIEKNIVGTWVSNDEKACDTNMEDEITFYDDGTVSGIEGFKTYSIEETSHDDYDIAILSGGYEDTSRFQVKIDENNTLKIIDESYNSDFEFSLSCHMTKKD